MLHLTNELKAKLLAAKSAEEVTELLKADGQEITAEDAASSGMRSQSVGIRRARRSPQTSWRLSAAV